MQILEERQGLIGAFGVGERQAETDTSRQALGFPAGRCPVERFGQLEAPAVASRLGEGLHDLYRCRRPVYERREIQRGLILFGPGEHQQVIIHVAPVRRVLRAQPFQGPQRGFKISAARVVNRLSVQARGLGRRQCVQCLGQGGERHGTE